MLQLLLLAALSVSPALSATITPPLPEQLRPSSLEPVGSPIRPVPFSPSPTSSNPLPISTGFRSTIYSWRDKSVKNVYRLGAPFLRSIYTALHIYLLEESSIGIGQVAGFSQKTLDA